MKVAIFPGHVGKDSGAIDRVEGHEDDSLMSIEAVINGQVAVLLKSKLDNLHIPNDIYIGSFKDRIEHSRNCELGISLHCDAYPHPKIKGFTTFHYPTSSMGNNFAEEINKQLINSNINIVDRGVKGHKYYILRKTYFPCVLLEMGYITNENDEAMLNNYEVQNIIAHSICNVILNMRNK